MTHIKEKAVAMDSAQAWQAFFAEWPNGVPPRGVLVTSFDEQISFSNFLTTESLLLVERQTPDAMGGRKVIIPYGKIDAVKVVDPVRPQIFIAAGFKASADTTKRVSK